MTEPLNILTATQLQWLRDDPDNWAESDKREALATIQAFAELLAEECQLECEDGMTCEGPHSEHGGEFCCIPCGKKHAYLQAYHGTGSEKEGCIMRVNQAERDELVIHVAALGLPSTASRIADLIADANDLQAVIRELVEAGDGLAFVALAHAPHLSSSLRDWNDSRDKALAPLGGEKGEGTT